jgi:hypothetical protein
VQLVAQKRVLVDGTLRMESRSWRPRRPRSIATAEASPPGGAPGVPCRPREQHTVANDVEDFDHAVRRDTIND